MDVVVRTDTGTGLQQKVAGLRENGAQGMGTGAVRGDGETGAKRRASLEQSLSARGVDLVSFKTPEVHRRLFWGAQPGGGGGDVAHTLAFQHHSWRSLVSTKLVHRFFRE